MKDQDYILFESYLSGELENSDIVQFEQRLEKDLEFNQSFITYKEMSSFLSNKFKNEDASKDFEQNLKKISEAHFNSTKTNRDSKKESTRFNFYKIAMAACVLLFIGLFTFNQFSKPSYGDFNNYESISLTVRGKQNDLLKKAEEAFNSKDFATANSAFEELLTLDQNNAELKMYSAISYIELNNFPSAEALLNSLKDGNSAFKNTAIWYLGLSKLKQKKNEECISVLKTIPENADEYEQAKALIDELE